MEPIVILESHDLNSFLGSVGGIEHAKDAGGDIYRMRFAIDGDGIKVKINEEMWSPPLGHIQSD